MSERRDDTGLSRKDKRILRGLFGKCLPTPVMPRRKRKPEGQPEGQLEDKSEEQPEEKWETSFFADLDSEFLIIDGRVLNVLDVGLKERLLYEKERRRWSDDFKKLSENSPSVFEFFASIN
jgi:hypothetical protein